jgi:hypothetical protein
MTQKEIIYRKYYNTFKYCAYSIYTQNKGSLKIFFLEYIEGKVGDYEDVEVFITENQKEILKFVETLNKKYPVKQIPKKNITLEFHRKEDVELDETIDRIKGLIIHLSFAMGLGVLKKINNKILKNQLETICFEFNIVQHSNLKIQINNILEIDNHIVLVQ